MKNSKGGSNRPASRLHSLSVITVFALTIASVTVLGHYMYGERAAANSASNSNGKVKLHGYKDHRISAAPPPVAQYNHEEMQAMRSRGEVLPRPALDETPLQLDDGSATGSGGIDGDDERGGEGADSEGEDDEEKASVPGEGISLPTLLQYGKEWVVQFAASNEATAAAPNDPETPTAEGAVSESVLQREGTLTAAHREYQALRGAMLNSRTANLTATSPIDIRNTKGIINTATWVQPPQPLSNRYTHFLSTYFSSRGRYVPYQNEYGNLTTNGTVFVYDRHQNRVNESCMISKISFKYYPSCSGAAPGVVLPLLVLGVQRSGTHVIVGALKELGTFAVNIAY